MINPAEEDDLKRRVEKSRKIFVQVLAFISKSKPRRTVTAIIACKT